VTPASPTSTSTTATSTTTTTNTTAAPAPPPTTTAPTTAAPPSSGTVIFTDGFGGLPLGLGWPDGSSHGQWFDVFNGFGTSGIVADGANVLSEIPASSTSSGETHSALVVSQPSFGDIDVTATFRTVRQLRSPTPNSWEVAWFLWHYTDNVHFYYVLLKPTGWELGKEDPAYPGAQRFLATGSSPTFAVGQSHRVRVVQVGSTITVTANGAPLVRFTDSERPYTSGAIGLYTEDAEAHFAGVTAAIP
jgi:hypothetical protein